MAKGYNRYNLLLRIKAVNERYLALEALGYSSQVIYKDYIFPEFMISRATMYNYLAVPYKKELQIFDKEDERQLKIIFKSE